jgi:hypothetical protein
MEVTCELEATHWESKMQLATGKLKQDMDAAGT